MYAKIDLATLLITFASFTLLVEHGHHTVTDAPASGEIGDSAVDAGCLLRATLLFSDSCRKFTARVESDQPDLETAINRPRPKQLESEPASGPAVRIGIVYPIASVAFRS